MNPNKYLQEKSFPAPSKSIWISFAWDGCHYYYLPQNSRQIYRYNSTNECVGHFDTYRQYNCFCYDCQSDCFWAASKCCPNTIFKLSHRLQEVDRLCLLPIHGISGNITGLSYNCACHELLAAFPDGIISLDTSTETFRLLNKLYGGCITGVLSIYPGYIVTQETKTGQYVRLFNQSNDEIDKTLVPNSLRIEQILYDPCHKNPVFHSLVTKKKCYSVMMSQHIPFETFGFQIDGCYGEHCKQGCPCTEPAATECPDNISIMQSIALMEASLSHILNAEGEKLQKALAETDDMHTIMCVNQQVTDTIIHVTHLEQLLYEKLSMLQKICCEPS